MLRFANYVFGLENASNNSNRNVTQTNVDDDWILIDIASDDAIEAKENNNAMQNQILAQNDKTTTYTVPNTAINAQLSQHSSHDRECDDIALQRNDSAMSGGTQAIAMDESWLVTPPPCFNSQLANAVVVETSPFENLLIEHPSMSVFGPQLQYAARNSFLLPLESSSSSSSSTLSPISDSSSSNDIDNNLTVLTNQRLTRQLRYQHQQQLRNNINQSNINITARTAFLTDFKLISSMQTAELAYTHKTLAKSNLDRQNKARTQRNVSQNRRIKMSIRPNGSFTKRSNNC